MNKMYRTLEFDKILKKLEEHTLSEQAKNRIKNLEPYSSIYEIDRHLRETTEAKHIIESSGTPPLSNMYELEKILSLVQKDAMLIPQQLTAVAQFLVACRRLKSYLKKSEKAGISLAVYGNSINDLSYLEEEINKAIRGDQVDDRASPQLAAIRRKIEGSGAQLKSKLESLLRSNSSWFSESFVAIRNNHYTLPVKRECKSLVAGTVIDVSQSGGTYFIEPSAAKKLQEEISLLHIEEDNEVRRILYTLTALVEENLQSIRINVEAMEILDFIFAKAKLSLEMRAVPIAISVDRYIEIIKGRHPLLDPESAVPLDFRIGNGINGVVITGPNTGGKTVALKTIGLFSLMAQSGLHIPAEGGHFTINSHVLCDIGDGQSITENLSTFSSHMTNIIEILKTADSKSLILLDELGSGTDPAEGMGLAAAILEELAVKDCLFVATTHYPEIKDLAEAMPGLTNARMAFDRESLLPLYRLEIGEAGESCALHIAKRLGLPQRLVERAGDIAYSGGAQKTQDRMRSQIEPKLPALKAKPSPHAEAIDSPEPRCMKFNIGDSVMVYPQKQIGIVYSKANEKGELGVQIRKKKLMINHKRLKLHVPTTELYPDNYDFSVIFDSVEARKKRHIMGKRHDPAIILETGKE